MKPNELTSRSAPDAPIVSVPAEDEALPYFHARYETLARIGSGGMGVVFRALDRLTTTPVAIKSVIQWGHGESSSEDSVTIVRSSTDPLAPIAPLANAVPSDGMDIAREFRTLASLRHPNVISVLDYGFDPRGTPFFTMELLDGWSTLCECKRTRQESISALIDVLQALRYLHRHGVVHRDIKPQNIMLGPDGRVKVLDFGLASGTGRRENMAGTYPFMAPEVLAGASPGVGSDLFSLGITACELLHGIHPKESDAAFGEEPALAGVLRRLTGPIAKGYPDAESAMVDLAAATGFALDPDPIPIRRSLIESAVFVGREAEIASLEKALHKARSGVGSAIVVRGPSGVGKSRLLEEIRVQALVLGVPVLQGQADDQGRSPYRAWREVLRGLCLHVDPTPSEAQALSAVVPNLSQLIGRPVEALGDAAGSASRLRKAVDAMVRRSGAPLLILIEDLQWADEQSAWLLRELSEVWPEVPVLVLASCREEDWRTTEPLAGRIESVLLPRLGAHAIASYCRSVLGADRPELSALLERETEGNAFFMVEVLRDLAERAAISSLTRDALPEHVSTGEIQSTLSRWLGTLPISARPALVRLAVAGRAIDQRLLEQFDSDSQAWLDRCAGSGVIDAVGDQWRFAHDKLREHVLSGIPETEKPQLHRDVATALETVQGDASEIATHWLAAGEDVRALPWAQRAAEHALAQGAPLVARDWYERTHALQDRLDVPAQERVAAWMGHARTMVALGSIRVAMTSCVTSLGYAGFAVPTDRVATVIAIAREVLAQLAIRLGYRPTLSKAEERVFAALERTTDVQQAFLWGGRAATGTFLGLRMLNLAERAESATAQARALVQVVYVLALIPFASPLRNVYSKQLSRVLSALDASRRGTANFTLGTVAISRAHWDEARSRLRDAIRLAIEAARPQSRIRAEGQLFSVEYLCARHDECEEFFGTMLQGIRNPEGNTQYAVWGTAVQGAIALRRGELDAARALFVEADRVVATIGDAMATVFIGGTLAWIERLRGDVEGAREVCSRTVASTRKRFAFPVGHTLVEGYGFLTQVADWLPGDDPATVLLRRQAWKLQRTHALVFPIARARLALVRGHRRKRAGKNPVASYRKALSWAQRCGMPYDEMLCHQALGESGGGERHAIAARELADRLRVVLP